MTGPDRVSSANGLPSPAVCAAAASIESMICRPPTAAGFIFA